MSSGSDKEIVSEFLVAVEGLSTREASGLVGRTIQDDEAVSHDDVARWRRNDWKRLSAAKRRALVKFLETKAEIDATHEVEGLLYSLDEVMRTLRKIDPEPGSQRARKKDALKLLREFWATVGESLPEWFWDIQERVERGEL